MSGTTWRPSLPTTPLLHDVLERTKVFLATGAASGPRRADSVGQRGRGRSRPGSTVAQNRGRGSRPPQRGSRSQPPGVGSPGGPNKSRGKGRGKGRGSSAAASSGRGKGRAGGRVVQSPAVRPINAVRESSRGAVPNKARSQKEDTSTKLDPPPRLWRPSAAKAVPLVESKTLEDEAGGSAKRVWGPGSKPKGLPSPATKQGRADQRQRKVKVVSPPATPVGKAPPDVVQEKAPAPAPASTVHAEVPRTGRRWTAAHARAPTSHATSSKAAAVRKPKQPAATHPDSAAEPRDSAGEHPDSATHPDTAREPVAPMSDEVGQEATNAEAGQEAEKEAPEARTENTIGAAGQGEDCEVVEDVEQDAVGVPAQTCEDNQAEVEAAPDGQVMDADEKDNSAEPEEPQERHPGDDEDALEENVPLHAEALADAEADEGPSEGAAVEEMQADQDEKDSLGGVDVGEAEVILDDGDIDPAEDGEVEGVGGAEDHRADDDPEAEKAGGATDGAKRADDAEAEEGAGSDGPSRVSRWKQRGRDSGASDAVSEASSTMGPTLSRQITTEELQGHLDKRRHGEEVFENDPSKRVADCGAVAGQTLPAADVE